MQAARGHVPGAYLETVWVQWMDTFEFNKIAGAVLGTALVVFGLKEVAGIIYHAEAPEKPGMMIEVAEAATSTEEAPAEETKIDLVAMMGAASADNGEGLMGACKACHTWDKGGAAKAGPNLWDIVGRQIAGVDGYKYSKAFTDRADQTWDYAALDAFLKSPKGYIPKTKMGYKGISDDAKRMDVIAFLRAQSDSPKPLPGQ